MSCERCPEVCVKYIIRAPDRFSYKVKGTNTENKRAHMFMGSFAFLIINSLIIFLVV